MTMIPVSRKKVQQLARTIVTNFNVRVADMFTTNRTMHGSVAAKINLDIPYVSGDAVAEPGRPVVIDNITKVIIIQCFRSVNLRIAYKGGELVDVPCNGLFALYGELDRVEVHADQPERFTYSKN